MTGQPDRLTLLLRALRKREGMRQKDLGDAAGINESMVGHVERGTRVFGSEVLVRVADALKATAEEREQLQEFQDERRGSNNPPDPGGQATNKALTEIVEEIANIKDRLARLERQNAVREN